MANSRLINPDDLDTAGITQKMNAWADANGILKESALYGAVTENAWYRITPMLRLQVSGTGAIQIDTRTTDLTVTEEVVSYTISDAENEIKYPYLGERAAQMRFVISGTVTVEIL